jgi:hypothetical protein
VDNIKVDLKDTWYDDMDWIHQDQLCTSGWFCEHSNDTFGSIKFGAYLDQLGNY